MQPATIRKKLAKERAFDRGKLARSLGQTREACPYADSLFSLRYLWLMGYDQQAELERQGRAVPYPGWQESEINETRQTAHKSD